LVTPPLITSWQDSSSLPAMKTKLWHEQFILDNTCRLLNYTKRNTSNNNDLLQTHGPYRRHSKQSNA